MAEASGKRISADVHRMRATRGSECDGLAPGQEHGPHANAEYHHHHTHHGGARHGHGHHLLQVEGLSIGFDMYELDKPFFKAGHRFSPVIDDLNISVHEGEIIALVGASGSGKSLLADCIMGIFEPNAQVDGVIYFDGERLGAEGLAAVRGRGISLVPQSVAYLDPLMKVGRQLEGSVGFGPNKDAARLESRRLKRRALFARYGLDESVAQLYPHQLSGGMARRMLLCSALMDDPKLIIADEPTPGLDLPLAKAAMEDFRAFADEGGGVLLITHDIELALEVADRVAVFREGTIVEETSVESFASPDLLKHPFSRLLWHALPNHDFSTGEEGEGAGAGAGSSGREGSAVC